MATGSRTSSSTSTEDTSASSDTSTDTSTSSDTTASSDTSASTSTSNDVSPSNDTSSSTRPADADPDNPSELTDAEKRDQDYLVSITPQPITARDALGIERIVAPAAVGYTEPQVEPDPHEVARLERLGHLLTSQADERLKALQTSPDGSARVAADAIAAEGHVGVGSA